ncbi:MAG: MMPL family transporter [Hyphomicrobium sp.]|nr:MMPL family transporter [Hyphomicrobium sp.]
MQKRIYGLAAWSPHPFPSTSALRLPASVLPGRVPPRIAQIVKFQGICFANVHLSHGQFLNRFQLEESRPGTRDVNDALVRTMHHIGPVIVLTTIVLALGLGVTILSHLPSLRLFGRLAGICLFASLIGQLIILPATVALYRRHWPRRTPAAAA